MYIVVSNGDSEAYYPDNKPHHFRVKLSKSLKLPSETGVGLCEIHISENTGTTGMLGLNLTICNGLILDGIQSNVLRKFHVKRNVHEAFPVIYYMPVEKLFSDTLEVYLSGSDGKLASLGADAKVECTLHFKESCISPMSRM
jgi:hypothetical protein